MDICPAEANQDITNRLKKLSPSYPKSPLPHGGMVFSHAIHRANTQNTEIEHTSYLSEDHFHSPMTSMKTNITTGEGFSSLKVSPSICLVEASVDTTTRLKKTSLPCFTSSQHLDRNINSRNRSRSCDDGAVIKLFRIINSIKLAATNTSPMHPFTEEIIDHSSVNESFSFSEVSSTSICPVEASSDTAIALEKIPPFAEKEHHFSPSQPTKNTPWFTLPMMLLLRTYSRAKELSTSTISNGWKLSNYWDRKHHLFTVGIIIQTVLTQVSNNNKTADGFVRWCEWLMRAHRSVISRSRMRNTQNYQRLGTYSRFLEGGTPEH